MSLFNRGRPPISESDQRRIKRMIEVNRPKTEIASVVGVCRKTVYNYGNKVGQTTRPAGIGSVSAPDYSDESGDEE